MRGLGTGNISHGLSLKLYVMAGLVSWIMHIAGQVLPAVTNDFLFQFLDYYRWR
jgi:hypothetical protein